MSGPCTRAALCMSYMSYISGLFQERKCTEDLFNGRHKRLLNQKAILVVCSVDAASFQRTGYFVAPGTV